MPVPEPEALALRVTAVSVILTWQSYDGPTYRATVAAAVRVLGIDLAAQAKKTYACLLDDRAGELHAQVHPACEDGRLRQLAVGCRKVAIDAPFGWPNEFVDALSAHRVGGPWPAPDD